MAQHKGQGSSRNGRDSKSKRRGVKVYEGQPIRAGGIILRQVGALWRPGKNTGCGRDWTIFSLVDGLVKFESGRRISVYPPVAAAAAK